MPSPLLLPRPAERGVYRLKANEAKHLSRVFRLGMGDEVEIFKARFRNSFASDRPGKRLGGTYCRRRAATRHLPPFPLVLASAAPKGDRLDWLVEKATELGVARLIPIVSERRWSSPGASKTRRLSRTVIEASKQCGRHRVDGDRPADPWSTRRRVVSGVQDGSWPTHKVNRR